MRAVLARGQGRSGDRGALRGDAARDRGSKQPSRNRNGAAEHRNPLPGKDDETQRRGNQVAIGNICERLQLAYGGRASLETSQDETDYQVSIALPVETI